MRILNDLIIRVSRSAWLFMMSALFAFGSLGFVFLNIDVAYQAIVGAPIFDLQNNLTVEQIFEQLKSVDESARSLYFAFAFVDFYFPFFAGLVMAAAGYGTLAAVPEGDGLSGRLIRVAVPMAVSMGVYCAVYSAVGGREIAMLWNSLKKDG